MPRLGRSYPVNRIYRGKGIIVAPTFDTLGAGGFGAGSTTCTWTQTATAGSYGLAYVLTGFANPGTAPSSVKYGTTAMTLLGSILASSKSLPGDGDLYQYGLSGVAGGSQTITVTLGSTDTTFGNSASFNNVVSLGSPTTASGTSSPASQAVSCGASQLIVQGFCTDGNAAMPTTSGGTNRYNDATAGASGFGLTISTATTSTTFTATDSGIVYWGGIGIALI